jgi:DNA-binding NarL/FixJ family response regulator
MNELLPQPFRSQLKVGVVAGDSERRAALVRIITDAGHRLVDVHEAEVVLADGDVMADVPTVILGSESQRAAGLLSIDATAAQIEAAVRAVASGLTVRLASATQTIGFEERLERDDHPLLTPRELEVLSAIGEGMSNKTIARKLGISLHTVKFHVESLFRKLGVRTRAEAVARGLVVIPA